jgi:hypothetical protein
MRRFSTVVLGFCLMFGAIAAHADNLQMQMQHENADDAGGGTSGRITGIVVDPAVFKVLSTDLKILGLHAQGCPAKAVISATFIANAPGKFHYVIGTTLGPNKHGVLEVKKVGNLYRAQTTLPVDMVKSGTLKVHAMALDFPESEAAVGEAYGCGVGGLKAN